MTFYTVIFGVSRAIGILSNLIWARAIMLPIERPGSVTLEKLEQMVRK
jgi:citrate synthase